MFVKRIALAKEYAVNRCANALKLPNEINSSLQLPQSQQQKRERKKSPITQWTNNINHIK